MKPFWHTRAQLAEKGPLYWVAYFEREADAEAWAHEQGYTNVHRVPGAGEMWRCERPVAGYAIPAIEPALLAQLGS